MLQMEPLIIDNGLDGELVGGLIRYRTAPN